MSSRSATSAFLTSTILSASIAFASPTLTALVNFTGANGAGPRAGLIADSQGNLYGTTSSGGSGNDGTVFEIAAGSRILSTLVNFSGTNGNEPTGRLINDAAGNLYGTTVEGGSSGYGTVFKIAAGTNTLSTLVNFNMKNGEYPFASLVADASGNLYGTTEQGGSTGQGTIFKIAAGGNALSTLMSFNGSNGSYPLTDLISDAAGDLFGTTDEGGTGGYGTVFKIAAGTNVFSTLASFNKSNGSVPSRLLIDALGNLYGTTYQGGSSNYGTVFEVAAGTNVISTLVTFNDSNGSYPDAGLIADASGNLYGTTIHGGPSFEGVIFKINAGTSTISTLANFDDTSGENTNSDLLSDASGNLYGTAYFGGTSFSGGTVFELTGSGFAVPEPSSLVIVGITGFTIFCRRKQPAPICSTKGVFH